MHTHPGRALRSRPGCPGVGRCRCRWGQPRPAGRGRTQSGRPGLGRSCGSRAPRGPRSRRPVVSGKAAAHSAGSGHQGLGRGSPRGEVLRPHRLGCGPGFRLRRRQGSQTRGTTVSRPQVLREAAGRLEKSEEQRGRGLDGTFSTQGPTVGNTWREGNADRTGRQRARWEASRVAGVWE